ncbi:MAG: MFS transporter [Rhodospirillales bacterium]|nr:MFS transporter [Rhodospirillales bacterium]
MVRTDGDKRRSDEFRTYLAGLGSWFVAFGIGMVMVQWIVADVLREPADRMGVAQMCLMGPAILFMLWGGAVADSGDPRRQLLVCHGLAALPPCGLALLAWRGELSFEAIVAYGLAVGTITAFAIPARDGLLPRLASMPLPRAVALATAAQFICQLLGIAAATLADRVGGAALLGAQALIVLAGASAVWRLPPVAIVRHDDAPRGLAALADGLRVARGSAAIWPVIALLFAVGLFYVATFMVALPIAVRDVYGGGSARLAMVNFAFWAGTIAASVAMMRIGAGLVRRGRAVVCALCGGMAILAALSALPPFPVMLALVFVWGVGAGVTMTQGRVIVQSATPDSHRGRVLALFQLGFMGGGPIGAPIIGALARAYDLTTAMLAACAGMLVVVVVVVARSGIWRQRLQQAR